MEEYKFKINENGNKEWYWKGLLHRDNDKPAVIYAYGTKWWYWEEQKHKDNFNSKLWYWKGKCHRESDNPAVIDAYGGKEYWKNGERVDKCRENE